MDFSDFCGAEQRGFSLAEAAALVMVVGIIAVVAVPQLVDTGRSAALFGAAKRLQGLMFRSRAYAIMNQRSTGLVFEQGNDGSWRCYIAADGDGDGIRRRDLESATDPVVSEILEFATQTAGLGILGGEFVPDPSGRGRLKGNLDDPVRAGRGNIITFTPQGHATPSSVYLTDFHERMRVVRVYGGTGRVISLVWRRGWSEWRASAL